MSFHFTIRKYRDADCGEISRLFYETIHAVNARDYTQKQLFAWAENEEKLQTRKDDLAAQYTLVAERDGSIVGFGSIDNSGCLDLLYVHKDYGRRGIATALCDGLEQGFLRIKTYASVTAKPFFEKRGYAVVKAQEVERAGVKLKNYEMLKEI